MCSYRLIDKCSIYIKQITQIFIKCYLRIVEKRHFLDCRCRMSFHININNLNDKLRLYIDTLYIQSELWCICKAIFNGKGPCHALVTVVSKLQFNYSNDPDYSGVIRTSKKNLRSSVVKIRPMDFFADPQRE